MSNREEQISQSVKEGNEPKVDDVKEEENDEEKSEVPQKSDKQDEALQMDDILETIFSYCDLSSLKATRSVNSQWHRKAMYPLLQSSYFTLPVTILEEIKDLDRSDCMDYMEDRLTSILSTFFLSHPTVPNGEVDHNDIKIPNVSIVCLVDLHLFRTNDILGPYVKNIRLCGTSDRTTELDILLSSQDLLPNWIYFDTYTQDDVRPNEFDRDLINALAHNTRSSPLLLGTLNMVTGLNHDWMILDDFEEFHRSAQNIFVEKLKYSFYGPISHLKKNYQKRLATLLSNLLDKSHATLTQLSLHGCEKYMFLTQFPPVPLTKVKILNLTYCPQREREIGEWDYLFDDEDEDEEEKAVLKYTLPPSFNFTRDLPHLYEVDLYFNGMGVHSSPPFNIWHQILNSAGSCYTTRKLTCSDVGVDLDLSPILQIFPRVENLAVLHVNHFAHLGEAIWKWGKCLKNIWFNIELEGQKVRISNFDSVFTGFSLETVDKIKNKGLKREEMGDLESLRVLPSILDLPVLEALTVLLHGPTMKVLPKKILAVAGEFAFALLPSLKVSIQTGKCYPQKRANDALEEVGRLSNVTIVD